MKVYNFEQRTPEWFAVRNLKLTASNASTIATAGKGLDTYVNKIVAEFFSDNKEEKYTNADMERGIALESDAIALFELETGEAIHRVGFIENDAGTAGSSPDGLIGEDGGVEVKCHNAEVYARLIADGEIDSSYEWQIQMNLLITGRKFWYYIGYNPHFKRSIFIKKFEPDLEKHAKLLAGIELGTKKIRERVTKIKNFIGENQNAK